MPRVLVFIIAFFVAAPASAHIGAGAGQTDILLLPDRDDVWMKAPWGFVHHAGGDADWRWVCHEVFSGGNESLLPDLVQGSDGTLFGVLGLLDGVRDEGVSLYRSADDGCTWDATTGLEDRVVVGVAMSPSDPAIGLAISADLDTGEGIPANGIWRTTDGGASWAVVQEWDGRLMRSVAFGLQDRAYAVAATPDPEQAWLLRSDDGGQTWQELPVPTDGVEVVTVGQIVAVHPADPDEVWLHFDGSQNDAVFRSVDGGQTFSPVTGIPDLFLDIEFAADGTHWLVGGPRQLWRSEDLQTWTQVEDVPQAWGAGLDARGLWLAVNTLADDRAVVRLEGGALVDELWTLDLAGVKECPAGSDAATVCGPLFDDLYSNLERMRPRPSGDDDDSAVEPPSPGCESGCGGGAALLPLILLGGLRRRG